MSELEQRIASLERQHRKLQFGVVAMGAILLAVPLVGAVQGVPEEIRAQKFTVYDERGNLRVDLDAASLNFYDAAGATVADLSPRR